MFNLNVSSNLFSTRKYYIDTCVRPNAPVKYPNKARDTNETYHDYMYWGYFNDNKDTIKGWHIYDSYLHRVKFLVQSESAPFDYVIGENPYSWTSLTFEADYTSRIMAGKVATDKEFKISANKTVNIPLWIQHEWEYEKLSISGTQIIN